MSFQSAGVIASAQSELQKYGSRSDILQEGTRQASNFWRRCIDYDSGWGRQRIRREEAGFQRAGGIAYAQSELQMYGGRSDILQEGTGQESKLFQRRCVDYDSGRGRQRISPELMSFQSAGGIASAQSELQKYGSRSDIFRRVQDRHRSCSSGAVLMMILAGVDRGHGPE